MHELKGSAFCETYNCSKRAAYYIGKENFNRRINYNLCPDCARLVAASIINNPDFADLLPKAPEVPEPAPEPEVQELPEPEPEVIAVSKGARSKGAR